jgi:hypothetical protein
VIRSTAMIRVALLLASVAAPLYALIQLAGKLP